VKSDFGTYRVELKFFIENNFSNTKGKVLDLGSWNWTWIKDKLEKSGCEVISFDKFKYPHIDVQGDIFELDKYFSMNYFDVVICADVMEHVNNPFVAISMISNILKVGGIVLFSCPFDKELHGEEYGDYWRITRQGWQELFQKDFDNININWYGRELMPKGYFIKARKKNI